MSLQSVLYFKSMFNKISFQITVALSGVQILYWRSMKLMLMNYSALPLTIIDVAVCHCDYHRLCAFAALFTVLHAVVRDEHSTWCMIYMTVSDLPFDLHNEWPVIKQFWCGRKALPNTSYYWQLSLNTQYCYQSDPTIHPSKVDVP